ncbi:MAG: hypothetical protein Q7R41_10985, partial [Phycisphaerales bacterium]|nr:hypothetical protein [Phycisphaerales bacterium]
WQDDVRRSKLSQSWAAALTVIDFDVPPGEHVYSVFWQHGGSSHTISSVWLRKFQVRFLN